MKFLNQRNQSIQMLYDRKRHTADAERAEHKRLCKAVCDNHTAAKGINILYWMQNFGKKRGIGMFVSDAEQRK